MPDAKNYTPEEVAEKLQGYTASTIPVHIDIDVKHTVVDLAEAEKILREALNDFRIPKAVPGDTKKWAESELKGDKGEALPMDLLQVLKNEKVEGETNHDYEERLHREVEAILQVRMNQ